MSQMKGSKNVSKMAFFLLPLGIAVNFIGGQVATLLNLPIYLDAIGTMVVVALCGPIYSVATALVTGLLMSITHPTNLWRWACSPACLPTGAFTKTCGNRASRALW